MRRDRAHWTEVADQWIAWVRTPGHDAFWSYRDAFLAFVGPGTGDALEIGCGEGRISRELRGLGYRVTATDVAVPMVAAAARAGSAEACLAADAAQLPFRDARFDLVLAYNVLMDVEDVPTAVREMARVMAPSGSGIIGLVHPFRDRGRFAGAGQDAPFVVDGTYFGRERFEDVFRRAGLEMRFAGWSQPLEAYVDALAAAGLAITGLREPRPDLSGAPHLAQDARIPLFLWLKVRRLPC